LEQVINDYNLWLIRLGQYHTGTGYGEPLGEEFKFQYRMMHRAL